MEILFMFGFFVVVILAIAGAIKLQVWNCGVHVMNAKWIDAAEKLHLVSRWGA